MDGILRNILLNCPGCGVTFDDFERRPMLHSCLNEYCYQCLQRDTDDRELMCQRCFQPYSRETAYPCNKTKYDLQMYINSKHSKDRLKCQIYGNCGNIVETYCTDCSMFYCGGCFEPHERMVILKGHESFRLDDEDNIERYRVRMMCNDHGQLELSHFCNDADCSDSICTQCFIERYRYGDVVPITEKFLQTRQQLEKEGDKMQANQACYKEIKKKIQVEIKEVGKYREEAERNIDSAFDDMIRRIEQRRKEHKNQLQQISERKLSNLRQQLQEIDRLMSDIDEGSSFLNLSLLSRNEPAVVKIAPTILERFCQLQNKHIDKKPHETSVIHFAAEETRSLIDAIDKFGKILSTTLYAPFTKVSDDTFWVNNDYTIRIKLKNFMREELTEDVQMTIDIAKEGHAIDSRACTPNIYTKTYESEVWRPMSSGSYEVTVKIFGGLQITEKPTKLEVQSLLKVSDTDSINKSSEFIAADITCPDFVMEESSVFYQRFLSPDRRILASGRNLGFERKEIEFKNYQGAEGTLNIGPTDNIYFEVIVSVNVKRKERKASNVQIYEIALAAEDVIDKHTSVGNDTFAWSLGAYHDDGRIVLRCINNGVCHGCKEIDPNAFLGVHVDRRNQTISFVETFKRELIYRFENVACNQKYLKPLFGEYNVNDYDVKVLLKRNIDENDVPYDLLRK